MCIQTLKTFLRQNIQQKVLVFHSALREQALNHIASVQIQYIIFSYERRTF